MCSLISLVKRKLNEFVSCSCSLSDISLLFVKTLYSRLHILNYSYMILTLPVYALASSYVILSFMIL